MLGVKDELLLFVKGLKHPIFSSIYYIFYYW